MKEKTIRRLAKDLSAGNQDLELLLGWSAKIEEPILRTLWPHQKAVAEEIMVLRVNTNLGTSFKRCDLLGCDGYFNTVPWETREMLKKKADILREKAKELNRKI